MQLSDKQIKHQPTANSGVCHSCNGSRQITVKSAAGTSKVDCPSCAGSGRGGLMVK